MELSPAEQSPDESGVSRRQSQQQIKKRSTRACDQCRKTKSRCDLPPEGGSCSYCTSANIECTVSGPSRKRGPPKGYLHAVETRLHEVEALVGIMLSVSDTRVQSFLHDLSKDAFAKEILSRVNASPFGPAGRANIPDAASASSLKGVVDPFVKGPTNEWQNRVIASLGQASSSSTLRSSIHEVFGSTGSGYSSSVLGSSGAGTGSSRDRQSSESTFGESLPGELVRPSILDSPVEGKLLSRDVVDSPGATASHSAVALLDPVSETWLIPNTNHPGLHAIPVRISKPPHETQTRLLALYFDYIYPSFPVIVKDQFWNEYNRRESKPDAALPDAFDILQLAMFAVAAPLLPPDGTGLSNKDGTNYFAQAKAAIDHTYNLSNPTICQTLLLLGMHQFGAGAATDAWVYIGMAIRLAQDLGLHRSADHWHRKGTDLFTPEQITLRTRIWYGCVKADRYISTFFGRPLTIRECGYDAPLSVEINHEEMTLWTHHPTNNGAGFYTPVPGRLISCFNANVSLSSIIGRILEGLYTVQNDTPSTNRVIVLNRLKDQLVGWLKDLPPHLQITDHNTMLKAPPHLLGLHSEYWCAVISLHRPFLRDHTHTLPYDVMSASSNAWEECLEAAQQINNLAKTCKVNFLLRQMSATFVYDIFYAGLIWVAALSMRNFVEDRVASLDFCLEALKEMESTHPCAARGRKLLIGAKIPTSQHRTSASPITAAESFARAPTRSSDAEGLGSPEKLPYVQQLLLSDVAGVLVDPSFINGYIWEGYTKSDLPGAASDEMTETNPGVTGVSDVQMGEVAQSRPLMPDGINYTGRAT